MRPYSSDNAWYRNLNLLSIAYVLRPVLRPRLTQSRSALLWKPWVFGRKDSHLPLATHSGILSSIQSTTASAIASPRIRRSSTPQSTEQNPFGVRFILSDHLPALRDYLSPNKLCSVNCSPSFGVHFSPVTFSAQNHSTSELLRTL